MLDLASAVAGRCAAVVRSLPTVQLVIGLGPGSITVDVEDLQRRRSALFAAWTLPGAAIDATAFAAWLADKETEDERLIPRAECTPAVLAKLTVPQRLTRTYSSGRDEAAVAVVAGSEHCTLSAEARQAAFTGMWAMVAKQQETLQLPEEATRRLRNAARVCALTCDAGELYGGRAGTTAVLKVMGCDDFVHWLPYRIFPEHNACHLSLPSNDRMRENACFWGVCLAKSAAYAALFPGFTASFSAVEGGSPQPVYGRHNPTPVFGQLNIAFSMHCTGRVTVWLEDVAEALAMRGVLAAIMVFNAAVTFVDFRVTAEAYFSVAEAVASLVADWRKTLCRSVTREHVAPYRIGTLDDIGLNL